LPRMYILSGCDWLEDVGIPFSLVALKVSIRDLCWLIILVGRSRKIWMLVSLSLAKRENLLDILESEKASEDRMRFGVFTFSSVVDNFHVSHINKN